MYLIKILVIQVIQLLVRSAPEQPVSKINNDGPGSEKINMAFEKELIDTVIEYYNRIDKNDLLPIDDSMPNYMCGQLIKHIHIQYLENNLLIILKQMFNHYLIQLENINLYNTIKLLKSDYVETMCSYFPRCIDFLYICSATFTHLSKILSLHSNLCALRTTVLTENNPLDEHKNTTHSSINILITHIKLFYRPFMKKEPVIINTEYPTAEDNKSFVKKIFEIVNNIDKTDMISGGDWKDISIFKDYFNPDYQEINLHKSVLFIYDDNNTEIQTLIQELIKIISDQGPKFLKTINTNYIREYNENRINHILSVHLLNDILLNVMRGIEYHFKERVSDHLLNDIINENQSSSIDFNTMSNMLSIDILQRICNQVPLILYYISSNKIIYNSLLLFSSYLTLCSDWIYFLTIRCQCDKNKNGEMLYNRQCVKQSVEEKILLNYFMVMRKTEYDDNMFNNGFPEMQSVESIILSIYNELDRFYASKDILVWTKFDWLVGIHIFTESSSSDDMNEMKGRILKLNGVDLSILEVYNQLLPWNLNINTVIDFNKLTGWNLFNNIFQYVWRQAKIIEYYFDNTNVEYVDDKVFGRLKNSTQWYRLGTSELEKIIITINKDFAVPEYIKGIIEAIENVGRKTINGISKALKLTSSFGKNWIDVTHLNYDGRSDLSTHLNETFLLNCNNALKYVNAYISIINKLKIKKKEMNTYDPHKLCKNHDLGNVFVVRQGQTRKYSETHDEDDASQGKSKHFKTA